jgi:hypothetical protein
MRSFSPPDWLIGWLLPVLAVLAEGALLAVVYVAIQTTVDGRVPLLGTFEFAVAAGVAALAVRRGWFDPDEAVTPFLGLLAVLGVIGWAWDASVRELVLAGNLTDAITRHPGGWLTVVAGMRGVGRGLEIDDRALTRLVLVGVPALAIPWTFGQIASGDLRPVFTEHAFVGSLTFVTAGFIAAGLARLQEIGRETGVDWRRNRSWLGTVFGVLVVVLALGYPAALLLGLPGDAVARGILEPVLSLLGYALAIIAGTGLFVAALLARMLRQAGLNFQPGEQSAPAFRLEEIPAYTIEQLRGPIVGVVALWIVLLVVGTVLLRVWLRRRARGGSRGATEERSFQIPRGSQRARRQRPSQAPRTVGRLPRPVDAVTAYLAALQELAANDPGTARGEHETPRAHARRVRAGAELDALQADYALARYGRRSLTDAEHRRAIGRWGRLRDRLRA